ncbi:MAG: nucleotidyl transferase AbiEii/AbiGii toxin family protein, partial [Planctomycetales bacterium]|nr:nucleotidyl transferase AbiEii/AbiGii toxin family protein [Planctomycetales bacterium]
MGNPTNQLDQIKQVVITAVLGDDELGDRLVLKGGNLLQYAYGLYARASKDVDISIDGQFEDEAALRDRVYRSLATAFRAIGLVVIDFKFDKVPPRLSPDLEPFWGGYCCEFKLVPLEKHELSQGNEESARRYAVDVGGRTTFQIDFSNHEFCDDKEPFVIDGHTVYGGSVCQVAH